MVPDWLTLDDVLAIHQDQIARYGGAHGVRALDLLEAAIAMPAAAFDGELLHDDLAAMAATYLWHIVSNHPFIDGNKRTELTCALVFLLLNGQELTAPENDVETVVWQVARGELDKEAVARFLRAHLVPWSM